MYCPGLPMWMCSFLFPLSLLLLQLLCVFLFHWRFQNIVLISTHDLYLMDLQVSSPACHRGKDEGKAGRDRAAHGLENLSGGTGLGNTIPKPLQCSLCTGKRKTSTPVIKGKWPLLALKFVYLKNRNSTDYGRTGSSTIMFALSRLMMTTWILRLAIQYSQL